MSDEEGRSSDADRVTALPIPLVAREDRDPHPSDRQRGSMAPIPLVRHAGAGGAQGAEAVAVEALLEVRDLTVSFTVEGQSRRVLDQVSFAVPRGKTVGLVGESGSGKTMTALSVLRLLPSSASIEGGAILLGGEDLLGLGEREMRAARGGRVGLVFQEPATALDPVYTVGAQVAEAIRLHGRVSRGEARRRAVEWLRRVGLPEPERRMDSYPHELSGGMRQRVMIAIALAPGPSLLIADEPTSALDMTTQAQILDLLEGLRGDLGMSMLLIAHDLALVAAVADEIVVLYAGQVVEQGPAREVLGAPVHPYTRALLRSAPPAGAFRVRGERRKKLPALGGAPPDLLSPPPGCRFEERCPEVLVRCREDAPLLYTAGPGRRARCLLAEGARWEASS